jgi:hypothetical protein
VNAEDYNPSWNFDISGLSEKEQGEIVPKATAGLEGGEAFLNTANLFALLNLSQGFLHGNLNARSRQHAFLGYARKKICRRLKS